MITGLNSYFRAGYLTNQSAAGVTGSTNPATVSLNDSRLSKANTPSETLSLTDSSMNGTDARSLKVAAMRDSIEAGQYRVPAVDLANAMIEKAETGSAPELSFLSEF